MTREIKLAYLNWPLPGKLESTDSSSDLGMLYPHFQERVTQLLFDLNKGHIQDPLTEDVHYRAAITTRGPLWQARAFARGRTKTELVSEGQRIGQLGSPLLGKMLMDITPVVGKRITNAPPGDSWHQWGLAVDIYPLVWIDPAGDKTRKNRKVDPGLANYYNLGEMAAGMGLISGGGWKSPDWPHVQFLEQTAPSRLYSWREIEQRMVREFMMKGKVT